MEEFIARYGDSYTLKADDFIKQLLADAKRGRVFMPEVVFLASQDFRDALESEKYGHDLRQAIKEGRIAAAMIVKKEGTSEAPDFFGLRDWYVKYHLYGTAPEPPPILQNTPQTRATLQFYEDHLVKRFVPSMNVSRDFTRILFANLDNPVIAKEYGKYHDAFKRFALDVYRKRDSDAEKYVAHGVLYDGNRLIAQGVNWVEPGGIGEAGPRNIFFQLRELMIQNQEPAAAVKRMGKLTHEVARAILTASEKIALDLPPVFMPQQRRQKRIWLSLTDTDPAPALVPGPRKGPHRAGRRKPTPDN
jgi:hypothetical protein